ncbi:hypothetical protein [Pseudonocardia sp. H11422]|uniref:hypothetical protein n=1 Tax=Pseudonocardia sp. H11422 TaxID=2835866 RepID=UPI001BDCE43D|nr:hypothetical protein [Pseudonocardia sp. H11422]
MSEPMLHRITLVVPATGADAADLRERLQRTLCPGPDHPGPCPIPWMMTVADESGFDPEEREHHRQEWPPGWGTGAG